MARKSAGPGRTLVVFFLGVAILYGLVAIGGTWKPALGLDLEGGTRITLIAKGNPSADSLDEARKIIDERVNGSGVSEAEVQTQGNRFITVEIPGSSRRDLIDTVQRQAQLRFRLVACSTVDGKCGSGTSTTTLPSTGTTVQPSTGATTGTGKGDGKGQKSNGTSKQQKKQSGNNRPAVGFGVKSADSATPSPSATPSTTSSASPTASATATDAASPSASASDPVAPAERKAINECLTAAAADKTTADPLTWRTTPTPACKTAFQGFTCPTAGAAQVMEDNPATPLITCDEDGIAYLLSSAAIEGTDLSDAGYGIPQGQLNYAVDLSFDGSGTKDFAEISETLVGTDDQFAIVLDGQVLSAPTMQGTILDGKAQITGDFTETEAKSLSTSLKYGSLPIAFEKPSTVTVGPSLAGDQLSAGILAGAAGLILVALYCLLYYRGLGLVVLGSLAVAAAITYAMVLLLGVSAGFTLTLPGIAGLIIAVGITADSFIIFFERIRDEMREGRSMRVAVETGWVRARVTRLAANVVSLLSAAVLYIFATGVVKGFGFALGLSTVIDLAVLFWFTKPMVSYLARYKFFNGGGRLSGLSAETLGMDAIAPSTARAGGKA